MKTLAVFNNKAGVGKTTLVFHLAWMFRHLGLRVLAADLDPQAKLTAAFIGEQDLEDLWAEEPPRTVSGALEPLQQRLGDFRTPPIVDVEGIALLPGDLGLSVFEDRLAQAWPACLDDNPSNAKDGFRVTTAFHRMFIEAARTRPTDLVLVDVGPNLSAINRAALITADALVVPLAADPSSLRGLKNLGPALTSWRRGWAIRRERAHARDFELPTGSMQPLGYVVLQHAARRPHEPTLARSRFIERLPAVFHQELLGEPSAPNPDPNCLALLRHFRSLLPLSLEARKPVFDLKAADGAIGSHVATVKDAFRAFETLACAIAGQLDLRFPDEG